MPRKIKSQDENPYEVIRGMWEGAYVSHFVRLFRKKFGFSCLTTQDLEEALVVEESVVLADVLARLLRYLTGSNNILIANFDTFLRNLLIKEKAEVPRYLENGTTWQELTPEEKLSILKWLIDHVHQEKEEDFADFLDENYSPDDLRGICAGQDAFNNVYWYLDDLRLYREASKKQSKKEWECVCLTVSDWYSFLKQFRKTTNVQEKELYTYLNFELFPIIEVQLLDKSKNNFQNKETNSIYLIQKEREELEVMLEKKTFLECSNGLVKSLDVNGADNGCHDKHNGAISSVKCSNDGNGKTDFKIKTEENKTSCEVNHCDGHLNISENISSVSNSMSATKMDVNVCVNNSCGSSCPTTCTNTQASTNSSISESTSICGNGSHCSNTSSTVIPVNASSNRDNIQDVNIQQSQSDNPSDSSSVTSNKENAPPASGNSGTDIPPMSAMSNMVGSTSTPATTASVQPLPSNMVNKTSFPLETQYMQQQSQIFVFSTELANKAAESYITGSFPSIIAFHCAQPGTKSFLEKYPLKVQQFNRQNPAAWLNTLATMKQGGRPIKGAMNQFPMTHVVNSRFPGPSPIGSGPIPCTGPCNVHSSSMCSPPRGQGPWTGVLSGNGMAPGMSTDICGPSGSQPWTPQPQQFGHGVNPRYSSPMPQGLGIRQMGPSNSPVMGCTNNMPQNMGGSPFQGQGMCPGSMQGAGGPSPLIGVKVPDENLTPEQRQHREVQLATIRKMQQLLFPEQQHMDQNQMAMLGQQQNIGGVPGGMLQHGTQQRFGPGGEMCIHSGMEGCFSPHQQCMNDHEHSHPPSDMFMGPGMMGPGFHQQNFPNVSAAAQLEWQKLQHQFFEERRKKQGPCGTVPLSHPSNITPGQSVIQHQHAQTPTPSQSTPQPMLQHPPQPHTPLQQHQSLNSPSPNMGLSPGTRMQGPPPPYHQTARRGMPSPHPASPNPSTLSLPSPRMVSGLSSPADPSRQFPHPTPPGSRLPHPSPGPTTPAGSNSLHTTPLNSPKPLNSSSGPGSNSGALIKTPTTPSNTSSTPSGTPTSSCVNALPSSGPSTPVGQCGSNRKQGPQCGDVQDTNSIATVSCTSADFTPPSCAVSTPSNMQDEMFCHGAHQCSQPCSKQEHCAHPPALCHKEPSLMPVPSPQQIQYLNAFDGQELTIQKQPNTSIRELDMMSPASMPPSMVMSTGSHNHYQSPEGTSFPNTPGSCPALENSQDSSSGRYPASAPASMEGSMQRFTVPSPQVAGFDTNSRHSMPIVQGRDSPMTRFPGIHSMEMMRTSGPGLIPHGNMEEGVRFPGHSQQGPIFGPGQSGNMDNIVRFPGSASEAMQRFRGPSPHSTAPIDMLHSRFVGSSPHMPGNENMPTQSFPSPVHRMSSSSSPCVTGNFPESSMVHSHLQNLQKMTPPFESIVGNNKTSGVASPMNSCSNPPLSNSGNVNVTPYGAGSPLTPASQIGSSQRLSHFDPIASMAAMSESTGPVVTSVGNAQTHQNMITSNIGMPSGPVPNDPIGNNPSTMMNFNQGISPVRGILPCSAANTNSHQHNQFIMSPHMPHGGCGSQPVNNSYINATMSVQSQNIHNVVTTTAFSAGAQVPIMNPHGPISIHNQPAGCQDNGTNTLSCSVTTNHPIMHSTISTKSSNVNMCLSGPRQNHPQSFPGQSVVQRNAMPVGAAISPSMMVRVPGAVIPSFNNTNIQVKASAPNTIQYLPARPQNTIAPNRPPSLEFLQRFAPPLTNLDNKVPTHNLQYFPNSRGSNTPTGHSGSTSMTSTPCGIGPGMMTGQRPVNMMMGPGPMMRGNNPALPHAGNQIFPVGSVMPGPESQMFGRPQCPPGSQLNSQMVPVNAMAADQGVPMFPNKQMPLSMGGMAPDATQPLPPSMGQTFNYKQAPFYSQTIQDPNYAVQFHNFQQQLYATNTRGSQINSQNNLSGQGFFGPK